MMYEKFSYLYDRLMEDVPYDKWVDIVKKMGEKYKVTGKRFLDLACGTGELAIRFAKEGYQVTGVDLSPEMLSNAYWKAEEENCEISFIEQNMTELSLINKFHIVGIFCDSLNYLQTEEEVKETFQNVYTHLEDQGLFLFDVHSLYKMNHIFKNQLFSYDNGEICYIWFSKEGEYPNSVEHEITFFVEDEHGKYDRFDEVHFQRTFSIDEYSEWLKEAGFTLLEMFGDFKQPYSPESERILFVAKKGTM